MKTIQELRDDRVHALRSAGDMNDKIEKENRLPTSEERTTIDDFMSQASKIQAEIDAIQAAHDQRTKLNDALKGLAKPEARKVAEAPNANPVGGETSTIEVSDYSHRYGKLKAFTGKDAELNALKSGMAIRAAFLGDYKARRFCEQHGIESRSMSENVNTAGGFLVPEEMSTAIIDLREQYGVFRRNCQVLAMGRDTITIPRRVAGLTAYFVAEGTAGTASDKSFDQVQLVAKKLYALTYLSTELAEDAIINIADDLAQEMGYAFALKEDQCGFNGDGTSTYGGIEGVTVKIVGLAGAVNATAGHDTLAEIDSTDLANLMGKLPAYARMGAKWFVSQTAFDIVFGRLAIGAGGNTLSMLGGAIQRSYLGYPIEVSQVLPTATTTLGTSAMILFGNLAQAATLGERRGIAVKRSDEIKFVEDQIALKATERIDINVHDLGDASTAGPVVALMGA